MHMLFTALFITFIPIQGILPSSANLNILPFNSVNLRYAQSDLGAEGVSTQDLNFNGNNVTVQKNTNKGLVMTTGTFQASSIFLKEQLKANEVNPGFSTYFVMNVYRLNPGPADGYVFVIAADSNSLGASGGGLGYTGISNSVGVEFDFYDNGGENLASSDIFTNGQSSASAGAVFDGSYINQWATKSAGQLVRAFHTWIEYDHLNTRIELRVAPSNEENPSINRPSRPVNALISRVTNLTQISNYFYAGFTAATGGLAQQMTLKSWYLSNSYIAGGIDPNSPNNVVDSQGPTAPLFEVNRNDSNYELQINGSVDTETSVAGYQYKIGNQPWAVYETTISTNTIATYRARAFDQAGNFSEESTMVIYEIIFVAANQIQERILHSSEEEPYVINQSFDMNGYRYSSWYDNSQFDGEPLLAIPAQTQSITLYSKPSAMTYNISYDLNLGETNTILPSSFTTGESINLPIPSKTGHTFLGWYFEDTFVNPIDTTNLPFMSFTAYAKWQINTYVLTLEYLDSTAIVENISMVYQGHVTLPILDQKPGYTFVGWTYQDQLISNDFVMPSEDVTLEARWQGNTTQISFITNTNVIEIISTSGVAIGTLPTLNMPEGYQFLGWSLAPLDTNQLINETYIVPNSETLKLYPIWIQSSNLTLLNPTIESIQLENQDWIKPMIIFTAVITLGLSFFISAYLKNKEHYGA